MSIEKIRAAAAAHTDDYVEVAAGDLFAALKEVAEDKTELGRHVSGCNPKARISVHRTHHLAKILGVAAPAVKTAKA